MLQGLQEQLDPPHLQEQLDLHLQTDLLEVQHLQEHQDLLGLRDQLAAQDRLLAVQDLQEVLVQDHHLVEVLLQVVEEKVEDKRWFKSKF